MTTAFDTSPDRQEADWGDQERAALVALLRARPQKMTWSEITITVGERGSALAVWKELVPTDLFGQVDDRVDEAYKDILSWRETGLGFLTFMDEAFPAQLREVREMPPVLFHKGTLLDPDAGVCVVGSRSASERGLTAARTIAEGLVQRNLTVVAGLAKGIDATAHRAALELGGRTVACIGTGISQHYPAENRSLQDEITRRGLVLSQFWPDAPPRKQNFPMRNAMMSGYGRATVVVEAGEHSGARIQARQAVEHGRPVVLTDMVVKANEWARSLLGRPGVYECGSTGEVMSVVERLVDEDVSLDALLGQLAF